MYLLAVCFLLTALSASAGGEHNRRHGRRRGEEGRESKRKDLFMNITTVSGTDVDLRCRVRLRECGNFAGVDWYRESVTSSGDGGPTGGQRVYAYRHDTGTRRAFGPWEGRARHVYDARGGHVMRVRLNATSVEDDGLYRCEITYEGSTWFEGQCSEPQVLYS